VGTSDGLYEYSLPGDNIDGQKSQLKTLAQGVGEVRTIGVSSDGIVLFVSSKQGLCYIDATGKVRSVKSDVDFTSLSLSKTDVVWAGTSEGQVYTAKLKQLINSGDIQLSKEASLTKGTVIRELVVGLRGHVWILSDLYLKEYNPITHISRLMNHSASNINMKKLCTINMESDSISLGGIGAFCLIPASEQLNEPGVALRPRI
jgi:ligand-binding sensor domain-containing protein